jgi:hypothetical protein
LFDHSHFKPCKCRVVDNMDARVGTHRLKVH